MPLKTTSSEKDVEDGKSATSLPATTAPTLRHRHEKKREESSRSAASASSTSTAVAAKHPPPSPAISLKNAVLVFAAVVVSFAFLVAAFVGLQVMVVDEMDLRKTTARMELAGRGEVWLPVWLGNFVVNSLTAVHADVVRESDGGGGPPALRRGGTTTGLAAPPPRVCSSNTIQEKERGNSAVDSAVASASSAAPPVRLRCYTLEAYSEMFLLPPRRATTEHLFSCGTRVRDLRSEDRPDVLAACEAHTIYPKSTTGDDAAASSRFATLRVLLTPSEEKRHHAIQAVNTVTQRIPLARVNDDYCDCLDGTDELLTNACSMSGPLAPAAGSRWKSYLVSNQAIQLYDDPDLLEQEDQESRGFPYVPRKRGDVRDRLYVSQGPILPFVCTCGGTVRQLLAPSLVGDGVVDCCGAEDEAASQSVMSNNPPSVQAALDRLVAAEQAEMRRTWKHRQTEAATQLNADVRYVDSLFPYHTSARALLVDKGYYSLFTPDVVQQERVAAAAMLSDLYSRGHRVQHRRVQKGWERLGQSLTDNRTALQMELENVTRELKGLERFVENRMEDRRTNNPIEAGVSMETLQRHSQLAHAHQRLGMDIQHLVITTLHHAYGDHYEYYPLLRRALAIARDKVTDANTPPDLYSSIAQEREKRVVSPMGLEQQAMAAQQRGETMLPPHIDNISASFYGIEAVRHTMVAQRFDPSEAPYVAQQLGLIPRGGLATAAFDPHVFDGITNPFLRSPVLPLGSWQPYQSQRDGRSMQLADPAGDLHLARRACVAPTSRLYRGGGRLQFPTRNPEPPRTITAPDEKGEQQSLKDKLKAAATEDKQAAAAKVYIPYHFHMPSTFVVEKYVGPVRCDVAPLPATHRRNPADDDGMTSHNETSAPTVLMYTTYLCDTKDRVLYWGLNGRCTQEVIIGTPSACTAWALKAARNALKEVAPRTPSEKSNEEPVS
ncbi:hypothetical protein ABB37_06933 [Leptomonas pyrrhocoris]|uniref:Glucosidase II beta subunit-like protein n=1 Tax=Leptomonas pyrrhocoris TaxID=157538 RepID=A0A0M9FWS6_LEPPY|nr:hypothetical protein ABB37_06933 [Leptomonas pyrrhocoris]KPA77559.1 hypothetical protein ABB37_06933 [Leptomonas pyrrhocoris]|eukprot:XP_015655998.1 hypothetical protein ABB37_06933 [Leptomonas pyrrhocoris]